MLSLVILSSQTKTRQSKILKMLNHMKILIDNGHGANTSGKCSPDKTFFEWKFNREIAKPLVAELRKRGYDAERIVTEDCDVSLSTRCKRVNDICRKAGAKNVVLISIHSNAVGCQDGWYNARGFSAHVGKNASDNSKRLAACLWDKAIEIGLKGNRSVPRFKYIVQNLAMCRDTLCPAVLTENLFYDNKEDLAILRSDEGKRKIIELHVEGIINYLNTLK